MKRIIRKIYSLLPFKKATFTFLKWFLRPSTRIHKHLHFHGTISIKIPGEQKHFMMDHFGYELENDLFWNGLEHSREKVSVGIWLKLCKNANTIIDAGANTGVYSLVASCLDPKADVFAFEPVEKIHNRLRKNILLNHFNIKSFALALSDYTGEGHYYEPLTEHFYSVTVNKDIHVDGLSTEKKTLQTITLDQVIRDNAIKKIDLMKLDVETHEPAVIRGFKDHLLVHRPDMLIEVLSDEAASELDRSLSLCNYLYYDINETTGTKRITSIQKSSERNILACTERSAAILGLK